MTLQNSLTPADKIIKAKVTIYKDNPFFSFLISNLKIKEDENKTKSCAVDNRGNLYFNPKWLSNLNNDDCKTLLSHEVMHIVLQHLSRRGEKDAEIFNIATDIVINNLLVNNNFQFGKALQNNLIPNNNRLALKNTNIVLEDIDKMVAEEVYSKIYKELKKLQKQNGGSLTESYKGFDEHIYDKGDMSKEEQEKIEENWKKKLAEAVVFGQQQGKLPAGIERYAEDILQSKMNWKQILYKYISQEIMTDWTYNRPSKRSVSTGIYLPRMKKEMIDVAIAIDTSGSIGKEELNEFVSEMIGIGNAFDSVRINLMFWDTDINEHFVVNKSDIQDIMNAKVKGGGGTDFTGVYEYLEKESINPKLLVFFSDGYATFPTEERFKTLWVVTENGEQDSKIPFGEVVRLSGVKNE